MKVIFPLLAKLFLLLSTSFIGGHGIINFLISIFYFDSFFSNAESTFAIISVIIYFTGVLVFLFGLISIRIMGKKVIKLGTICDLIAFIFFCLYAIQFNVNYGMFLLTSLPFIGFMIASFYVHRNQQDSEQETELIDQN